MNRTLSAFLLVAILTGLLVAFSFGLQIKGYPFGSLGVSRLDGLANAKTFIPLAAIYALSGALIVILPLRTAGMIHSGAASPVFSTAVVLLATIFGVQVARFAFGVRDALSILLDWQFLFAAAIVVVHLSLDTLRRNALLRTLSFIGFIAATLACLYWTFRL